MVQGVPKSGTRSPEQDMGRVPVSNGFGTTTETFSNTISIPLAIAGSRPRAGWLPALTKSYRNLPLLPVASWNPGKKTTVIWSSCGMTNECVTQGLPFLGQVCLQILQCIDPKIFPGPPTQLISNVFDWVHIRRYGRPRKNVIVILFQKLSYNQGGVGSSIVMLKSNTGPKLWKKV